MAGNVKGRLEVSMTIERQAYTILSDIVGAEYISDDPVDIEAYRGGPEGYGSSLGYGKVMSRYPGAVIMPKTTGEVQKIVKKRLPQLRILSFIVKVIPHIKQLVMVLIMILQCPDVDLLPWQ